MNKTVLIAIAACGEALSLNSYAQAVCGEILRSANYNQYQSVSQNQQYSLQKANFCLAEYEKSSSEQKAQIEASYKLFSGGASGSSQQIKERQHQECDSKYGEYWFSQLGLTSQKIVSDKAMDTVSKCLTALSQGLKVEPTFTENEEALSVSLTWTRSTDLPFKAVVLAPSTSIRCKIDGKYTDAADAFLNRVIKPGTSTTFSCERSPSTEVISGEKIKCLPPALVAIDVLESPVTLNLFRRCETDYLTSRANEVDRKVRQINEQVISIQNGLKTNSDRTIALETSSSRELSALRYTIVPGGSACPSGWSRSGSIGWIMLNKEYDATLGRGAAHVPDWTWVHPTLCKR